MAETVEVKVARMGGELNMIATQRLRHGLRTLVLERGTTVGDALNRAGIVNTDEVTAKVHGQNVSMNTPINGDATIVAVANTELGFQARTVASIMGMKCHHDALCNHDALCKYVR